MNEQSRALDDVVQMTNKTISNIRAELQEKDEVIQAQADKIFLLEKVLKEKTRRIKKLQAKGTNWLIDGISKEQFEAERVRAIQESAMELFVVQLRELSFCDQLSMNGERLIYMEDVESLLQEMKSQLNKA